MKPYIFAVLIAFMFLSFAAEAQVGIMIGPRMGYGDGYYPRHYPRRQNRQKDQNLPKFQPTLNISIGYGFPNLDKYQLPAFYNYYLGNVSQTGPVTGAVDYQFSRSASIGVMVTHGTVNAPYYNYNTSGSTPDFNGSLENWSIMLNYVNYMPVAGDKVSPYFRTAIGVNMWNLNYTDNAGNHVSMPGNNPSDLAYQVGLGVIFHLTPKAGLFVEGGYGKYILHSGLSFKF
jgi:hypothetical protein